jgi:plastocyanin
MGVAMATFMNGGMHRGNAGPQTPVVATAREVSVEIRDFDYSPRDLTVNVGTAVSWVNQDSVPHDATSREDTWKTERLDGGDSGTIVLDAPGRFEYYCSFHPYMEGAVTVR